MKAKLEINEAVIKQALLAYFKSMNASDVSLTSTESRGWDDRITGLHVITGTVTIDVGEVAAQ